MIASPQDLGIDVDKTAPPTEHGMARAKQVGWDDDDPDDGTGPMVDPDVHGPLTFVWVPTLSHWQFWVDGRQVDPDTIIRDA